MHDWVLYAIQCLNPWHIPVRQAKRVDSVGEWVYMYAVAQTTINPPTQIKLPHELDDNYNDRKEPRSPVLCCDITIAHHVVHI